ncbi:MAG TPA: type II toxin-antitoxin system HicB family antitoxin [Pseudomonas sp.]|uniref:type II toxin-antitoxin system HicB family antitoxin n=1 Tax=Pseudomonas sp. TaxID=306 RepID=UPI002CC599D8|nr:type II toxin-antitoxin system HicB family antitoxin [Pseudomonas sp.]HTO17701.1 type II toxin-antitoxin system HicB family antitoxin [Pseudomonas sp.]
MEYYVEVEQDTNGSVLVTCFDIPEFVSVGDDIEESLVNAVDGLEAALEIYIQQRRKWPAPAKRQGVNVYAVRIPALVAAKAMLHNEMVDQGVRKAELARRLHVAMPQVDRLLDVKHKSKIEGIEEALERLGRRLEVSLV